MRRSKFDTGAEVVVRTPDGPAHKHHGERGFVESAYPGHWIAVRFEDGDYIVYLPEHVSVAFVERGAQAALGVGRPLDGEIEGLGELAMAGRGDELEELRKAAKSVLLAYSAGREPEARQWARLANALDTEKRG